MLAIRSKGSVALPKTLESVEFPVLLWRKGYSYVARSPVDLCTHPRSLVEDTRRRSKEGEFTMADSHGRLYEVADFEPVEPFGGFPRVAHFLLRSVFAAPTFRSERRLEAPEFCGIIGDAVRGRFGKAFAAEVAAAPTPQEAIQLVARRDRKAG